MQPETGNNPTQSSTGRRLTRGARLRSLIPKNLTANPDLPRIYAEILESEGHNFNEAKDLAIQLQKKVGVYKPQLVTGLPSPAMQVMNPLVVPLIRTLASGQDLRHPLS